MIDTSSGDNTMAEGCDMEHWKYQQQTMTHEISDALAEMQIDWPLKIDVE
jgi:hypothetical protein